MILACIWVFIVPVVKGKSAYESHDPSGWCLSPVSIAWSDQEYFYSPLDGMLVHRWVTLSNKFTGTQLYTWVERDFVRVKCLDQEHNSVSARARTRTARSGVKHTNHEASTPPHCFCVFGFFCFIFSLYFLSLFPFFFCLLRHHLFKLPSQQDFTRPH